MGSKLFYRDTRNVELTAAGESIYNYFRSILEFYLAAKQEAAFFNEGKGGTLKISSPYYWTGDFVEPVIEKFAEKNSSGEPIIFSCQPPEGLKDMIERRSDIFVNVWIDSLDENIRRIPFATESLCVVMCNDHPLAGHSELSLTDLYSCDFVFQVNKDPVSSDFTAFSLNLLAKHGVYPKKIHYTQQVDTAGLTMHKTGGILMTTYCVRHMNRQYLKVIPLTDKDCNIPSACIIEPIMKII